MGLWGSDATSETDFHDLTINSFDFAGEVREDENEDAPYAPNASEGADDSNGRYDSVMVPEDAFISEPDALL